MITRTQLTLLGLLAACTTEPKSSSDPVPAPEDTDEATTDTTSEHYIFRYGRVPQF